MSVSGEHAFRRLSYASEDGREWGFAAFEGERGTLVTGTLDPDTGFSAAEPLPVTLATVPGRWTVRGDGAELEVEPDGDGVELHERDVRVALARCRVGGMHGICIEHAGWRAADVESLRDLSAWFGEGGSYGLLALRPRKAKGHDRDAILSAVLAPAGEQPEAPVEDGRLSTSQRPDGALVRAGLELWLEPPEPGPAPGAEPASESEAAHEPEPDREPEDQAGEGEAGVPEHFPHRIAGEALGGAVKLETESLSVEVTPLVVWSRGRESAGAFGLEKPR